MWCRVVDPTFFSSWKKRSSFSGRRRIGRSRAGDVGAEEGKQRRPSFLMASTLHHQWWGIHPSGPAFRVMALAILHLNSMGAWALEQQCLNLGSLWDCGENIRHLQRKIYSWKYKHLHLISRTQVFIVAHPHTPSHWEWLHRSQENNPIFRNYSPVK